MKTNHVYYEGYAKTQTNRYWVLIDAVVDSGYIDINQFDIFNEDGSEATNLTENDLNELVVYITGLEK